MANKASIEVVEYIRKEKFDSLFDIEEASNYSLTHDDSVFGKVRIPYPPDMTDLVRIHQLVRLRKSFTVMEFGLGYSTIVIADALRKNKEDWQTLTDTPAGRNRFMFQLFSVDGEKQWMDIVQEKLPEDLKQFVQFHYTEIEIGTFDGQLCHYFKTLPDIVPDFIYVDGPDPKSVKGNINGLSFQCDERTVMSGDLLLMESTFLPGTFILVDGRTNNVRFLKNNFKRKYKFDWDREADVSTFELDEERLGKYNILGSDFF